MSPDDQTHPENQDQLSQALEEALKHPVEGELTALLWLDMGSVGGFQSEAVALAIRKWLRPGDCCSALDSRHVAVMLPRLLSEGQAVLAAHRVLDSMGGFDSSAALVRPRVGIALAPLHAENPLALVAAAESAAEQMSAGGVAIYDQRRDKAKQLTSRIGASLRHALNDNALHLVYQPQISLASGQCAGAEALIRWDDPVLGSVPAYEIITVAEQMHMLSEVTRFVLNTGLRETADLCARGYRGTVSVNLGASDLMNSHLPEIVQDALAIWNLSASRVIFELTESAAVDDIDATIETLKSLRKLGCGVALDDFGTGFSSLTHLRRLPINKLKIDRSFIKDLTPQSREVHIVESVIALAHRLGIGVVAEGVEDLATADVLRQMHCDQIQGYCYSRPLSPENLFAFTQHTDGTVL